MFTARVLIGVVMGAALALPAGKATAQGGAWPSRPIRLVVPLPPLAAGTYELRYQVLAADGHATQGVLRFRVAQ